jgi:hypothetical protein
MQVLEEKSSSTDELAFVRGRPTRAVTLAGVYGVLLSLVPLFIAPGLGPVRLLSSAVLLGVGAALLVLGRSRLERFVVVQKPGIVVWADETLPAPSHVALRGDETEEPPLYRAVVVWSDGRERVAAEGSEPGPVLKSAFEVSRRLGIELRPGWGLEGRFAATDFAAAWERASSQTHVVARPMAVDLPLWPVQRHVAGVCLATGLFVPLFTAVVARAPERTATASALELWLTGLSAAFALALGVYFAGIRRRVELAGGSIRATPVFFGSVVGKPNELAPAPTAAFAVTPNGGFVRHVVFATPRGPISLPTDAEGADRLAAPALGPAASERAEPELPLVTSARYRGPDRPARLRS